MDLELRDKTAIVTGGARGLGRAVCLALAREGARVAVNYRSSAAEAQSLIDAIRVEHAVEAIAVQADVAKASDVAELFDRVEATWGKVDVLVNNAGIWPTAYVHEMTEAEWDESIEINLKAPFLTCREAVRRWLAADHRGRIVNVVSPAAFLGSTTGHAHYAAAKAGVASFTVSLAREVAAKGIHVNAVAPGMMQTDMAREALESGLDAYLRRIPLRRIAEPAEVADVVTFLASPRASYTTGATLDVSGGMLMR
jgi:3-oxoacyl-[acyl-carrier protein] reductase